MLVRLFLVKPVANHALPSGENVVMQSLLAKLHLTELNPGACTDADGWIEDPHFG